MSDTNTVIGALTAIGYEREEIAERLVEKCAEQLLRGTWRDEDGEPNDRPSAFAEAMKRRITQQIDKAVEEIAAKHVLPNVTAFVESFAIQATNKWGEKIATPLTFTEYLVKRAEAYITEPVNHDGKSKEEAAGDYSGFSAKQTRIAHLIHAHLHYSIETAMKAALAEANKSVAKGLRDAVEIKLQEVAAKLKVQVSS